MKQEELIKSCTNLLYKLCDLVEARNNLNYYDINISSEYFFIPLLNLIFDCNLKNLNSLVTNAAAIDLYDENGKLAVQVTSNSSAAKIHKTLKEYHDKKLYQTYNRLIIIVIAKSHTYTADFTKDTKGDFSFSKENDIITINSIIRLISNLDIKKIENIQNYLYFQLETIFDETQVSSLSQSFSYISSNTKEILNEDFFEIDDERFINEFSEKIENSNVLHIYSLSVEEGKYCILNLLHRKKPSIPVYVIHSKEAWKKAENILTNCIAIPDFESNEIPALKNNTTIFIQNDNKNKSLILSRRTRRFLSQKLQNNGYNDSYKLLEKTQGLYYYIKKSLFTGEIGLPDWENDTDRSVIVASLLGKWTENAGDKEVIEMLYGNSYDNFITYLNKYMGNEFPLLVQKRTSSYNYIYELADPLLSICSHGRMVILPIINDFFDIAKTILSDRDPEFNKPFEEHYSIWGRESSKYSNALKTGITRTLLLLALYADYQEKINYFVNELLSKINTFQDWAYYCQFFELLCEAAPEPVLSRLEKEMNNDTGLLSLFTAEKSDILFGKHYYTHILWSLEQLLQCKEYVVRSVNVLLTISDNVDKCSIGNNPREELSKIFCTWYNVSALEKQEKIELASIAIEKHSYFWDILYNVVENTETVSSNSKFLYRETKEITQYTHKDQFDFLIEYTKLLISKNDYILSRLIKLLKICPRFTSELFENIQTKTLQILGQLCDSDREKIKTELRKIIYEHRHFANAEWAAPEERVSQIENLCLSISFDDAAYDFLYLIDSNEIPILHPVIVDSTEDYYSKNQQAIESVIEKEFMRMKSLNISLEHILKLSNFDSYTSFGISIARYYCNFNYDDATLDIIIDASGNCHIAIDYVTSCMSTNKNAIYDAVKHLRINHFADDYYIAFLSILPLNEKNKFYVTELPEKSSEKYWKRNVFYKFESKELLFFTIENLVKHSNWTVLFTLLNDHSSLLCVEELINILLNSINQIIMMNQPIGSHEGYLLKQIISNANTRIREDFDNYPNLLILEIKLSNVIGWNSMKSTQHFIKRNANIYAEIISHIYKRDDGEVNDKVDSDNAKNFYHLEHMMKFCPGEENGNINKNILNNWIETFKICLTNQGQSSLFYHLLGKLFSYSPTDIEGKFPHKYIREVIEEIGNDELIESFEIAILNSRGAFYGSEGKEEYNYAQKYRDIGDDFQIRYPKTAKIFYNLSNRYLMDSKHERNLAENSFY